MEGTQMSYTEEDIHNVMRFYFDPEIGSVESQIPEFKEKFGEGGVCHEELAPFQELLRRLIVEDPRPFKKLASDYMGYYGGEEWLERYFRDIWQVVLPDEPWPEKTVRNGGK
jgi:hypothetical protein